MRTWITIGIGMAMVGTCWAQGGGGDGLAQRIPFSTESRGSRDIDAGGDVAAKAVDVLAQQLELLKAEMLREEERIARLGQEAQRTHGLIEDLERDRDEGADLQAATIELGRRLQALEQARRDSERKLQAMRLEHAYESVRFDREAVLPQRPTRQEAERERLALEAGIEGFVGTLREALDSILILADGHGLERTVELQRTTFDPANRAKVWDWLAEEKGIPLRDVLTGAELNRLADSFDNVFERAADAVDPHAFLTRVRDVLSRPDYVTKAVAGIQRGRRGSTGD